MLGGGEVFEPLDLLAEGAQVDGFAVEVVEGVFEVAFPEGGLGLAGLAEAFEDGCDEAAGLVVLLCEEYGPVVAFKGDAAIEPFPGAGDGLGVAGEEAVADKLCVFEAFAAVGGAG